MTHENLKTAFLQGGEREAAELMNEVLRGCVREAFWHLMSEEVEALCGPRYRPDPDSAYHRAGSEQGSVFLDGGKEEITRPRVRHDTEGEVRLDSYAAASSQQGLFEEIVGLVGEGISQRGLARSGKATISKSSISRMWEEKSRAQLAALRERPIGESRWLALMIDGVFLGGDSCIVVALGIDEGGRKQVLDFEPGNSESQETVSRLLSRLEARKAVRNAGEGLLIIRDGSEAIKSAINRHWPKAGQQTCLVHLERNIADRLRQRDRSESQRLFRRLRDAEGREAGEEAFEDLREFLAERNAAAALALKDRKDDTLRVHRLNLPSTLNVTLLSTNIIENAIRNWREHTGHVKRWSLKSDMIERWAASGMLWAESGFRRVRHHKDLPHLAAALGRDTGSISGSDSTPAASLRSSASVPSEPEIEDPSCNLTPS
jgi:transposase-like protein